MRSARWAIDGGHRLRPGQAREVLGGEPRVHAKQTPSARAAEGVRGGTDVDLPVPQTVLPIPEGPRAYARARGGSGEVLTNTGETGGGAVRHGVNSLPTSPGPRH